MASLVDYGSSDSEADPVSLMSGSVRRVRPGVKPYVSKRRRLTEPRPVTPDPAPPPGDPLLWGVSESVRPYLGVRQEGAELPRRVRFPLRAHQGPVSGLQWCPVEPRCHLLLSASMDGTCKVWDGVESGRCLRTYSAHSGAVRDARWLPCGRRLLSGSFDGSAAVTDVESGAALLKVDSGFRVCCVAPRPTQPDVFLCGGFSSEVRAWDARSGQVVRAYGAAARQTLDLLFLSAEEFISSTDAVSRDSADRTLMAWDFRSAATLSNQIYQERFTCPALALHPLHASFVAQTNGNYVAQFSARRPYRINRRRRYEGHKVEGFGVRCSFSSDGSVLVSGSSTGAVHFYQYQSGHALRTLPAHTHACVSAVLHPLLPGLTATGDWSGSMKIWS